MDKEPKQKPEEETKSAKSVRDKNGRFASKKPSDGKKDDSTVKIKVVKPKKTKPSKEDENEKPSEDGICYSISGFWTPEHPIIGEILSDILNVADSLPDCDYEDDESDEVHEGWQYPDGTLKVDGKIYLPQDKVAHLISRTIDICSQSAAEYIDKHNAMMKYAKDEEVPYDQEPKDKKTEKCGTLGSPDPKYYKGTEAEAKTKRIAQKLSKIAANIIMCVIGIGLLSGAVFGLYNLYTLLFR